MSGNLQIQLTGTLNTGLTITEINNAIKGIEKSANLQKIKLQVDIDPKTLDVLKKLSETLKKMPDAKMPKVDTSNLKQAEKEMKQFKKDAVSYYVD
ncbi:MAG TPA: hypothetical protein VJ799_00815, partial [Nitrososphaeraceae archaeon]|nr:hypothetical protein [Nitrososphaeraceae archaeon]